MKPALTSRCIFHEYDLRIWRGGPTVYRQWHSHNEVELNFIERGGLTYSMAGKRLALRSGELLLFWGITPHWLLQAEPGTRYYWISLPLALFLQWNPSRLFLGAMVGGEAVRTPAAALPYGNLRSLFGLWHREFEQRRNFLESPSLLELQALVRRLAEEWEGRAGPAGTAARATHGKERVARMALFISGHYLEPLSVAAVARAAGVHPHYAMEIFKNHCGMSIATCIARHRFAHARRLLVTTDATMASIAFESGFGSLSQFYASFQRFSRVSPREIRLRSLAQPRPLGTDKAET